MKAASSRGQLSSGPYFAEILNNVTIPVSRRANFQCNVRNLKSGDQVNKNT